MREIEKKMISAIRNRKNMTLDNTVVFNIPNITQVRLHGLVFGMPNITQVRLHGHIIAEFDWTKPSVRLSNCGWSTNTTRSRLNALFTIIPGYHGIHQKKEWYLTGKDHNVTDWTNNQVFQL
jgi:hypothetical protein